MTEELPLGMLQKEIGSLLQLIQVIEEGIRLERRLNDAKFQILEKRLLLLERSSGPPS